MGASGAISGVVGAYLVIHPFNKTLLWAVIGVFELPAIVVIGLWFLLQYLAAFIALDTGMSDGVAYWCHLGGFGAGFVSICVLVIGVRLWPGRRRGAAPVASSDLGKQVKPGEDDPYGSFLTVQVMRKLQEKTR